MTTKLAWFSTVNPTLYTPIMEEKHLPREDVESVMIPMEGILLHIGLCVDEQMRLFVGVFAETCQRLFVEVTGDDRNDVTQKLMEGVSAASGLVQKRAREILNDGDNHQ
jgi:hypothetical protein